MGETRNGAQEKGEQQKTGLKVVVVGDGACGKTSLLKTFNSGQFPTDVYMPTIFDLCIKDTEYQGQRVELSLWDTAGQEDYDRLRIMAYPGTNIVIVCFSVETIESLENTFEKWLPEVRLHAPAAKVLLVALKIDLRTDQEVLEHMGRVYRRGPLADAEGRMVASRLGVPYIECSARKNQHVGDVFLRAIELVYPNGIAAAAASSGEPGQTDSCCTIL
ncbi:GTP-binding protein Rho1 [Coemansia sp. RSA 1939]|nr:GTP-binding protein Rho1 [Coemansia sp. RSA 1939]KAJ2593960.1 GTP-binding protein Rho1 [Coemansia sp. RSA 1804]